MEYIKNSEIAKRLGISHPKVKRLARELLSPDSKATMQSGYARKNTIRDAYIIWIGGHLVSDLNFTVHQAKEILRDLDKWLAIKGLYPDVDHKGEDDIPVKSWQVTIMPEKEYGGFCYKAIGTIEEKSERYKNRNIYVKKYIQNEVGKTYVMDEINVKILRISRLFEVFKLKIEGKKIKPKKGCQAQKTVNTL